ncbi:MAG: PEP-CTERM sorting domain-containing protein [Sedimentisphaerales bacterium]
MKAKVAGLLFMAAVLLAGAPLAKGYPVTIYIEAVVDTVEDSGNYLEGQINAGDIITGYYTYESTTPDSSPLDPVVGHYYHYSPPSGTSLTVSNFEFKTDPANVDFLVGIVNNNTSGQDIYWIDSYNNLDLSNGTSVDSITWQLNDPTGTVFSSDALPTTAPVLEDWQSNHLRVHGERGGYFINAHVTSAIPEPATILLFSLGGLFLRKRG